MINLDLKDKKILYQLDLNSRQSNSEIAKKVQLSKDIVNYRIKKLESEGFISGYYTIINFYQLGYISIRVYIKLVNTPVDKENEILDFLINNKNTFFVVKIDGNFDIGFGTYVKDIYQFEEFYQDFKKNFKKYIGKEQISIFTKVYHFHRPYIIDKEFDDTKPEYLGGKLTSKYDKLDIEILKLLANNSRIPITEISSKLKIPVMTASFRIKQLEKKEIIQGYRFVFDFKKFNYEYYKVDIVLDNTLRLKELINYIHSNPNTTYIDQTIAGSDFEFELEVKSKEHLLTIIDELRIKFPEIRELSYFTIRKYKKLLYFPEI
ncbi:Lrp/AsnC family transcriptional regulator [Candidatus Woesearchaeota archaeon]|nr:Lrp/AsnC family transcriptional regulator [Candidatus Woesearchaeota archaeon]